MPPSRPGHARQHVRALATTLAALALLAAGCSSGHKSQATPSPSQSSSPAPSPSATLAASANPLTGAGPRPSGPVMAIKVDNAPSARPLQQGLSKASIVYQELVEGGATRYMAMFVGRGDFLVGPCRSARLTDLQILAPYGRVILGFSGANRHVLAAVRSADVVDVSQYEHPGAFETHGRRPEAWNFFTSPSKLEAVGGAHASGVRDIGLRFGPVNGGRRARAGEVWFNSYSHASFAWDAGRHGWRLSQDGRPMNLADGTSVVPANIVVQFVRVTTGAYHDVLGNYSPDSHTIGRGAAYVFRDGRMVKATWSRPSKASPTHLLEAAGSDVLLRPGQTWFMLVPVGQRHRVTVS